MRKREQRALSEMGVGYVPCEVSGRYLSFQLDSAAFDGGREFITVAVMTEARRKLCSLIVQRRDMERALSCVKPKKPER